MRQIASVDDSVGAASELSSSGRTKNEGRHLLRLASRALRLLTACSCVNTMLLVRQELSRISIGRLVQQHAPSIYPLLLDMKYSNIETGILSDQPRAYFQSIQDTIDQGDPAERCQRYSFSYNLTHPKKRRIFYGALIANEPWELFDMIAAESHGIFSGMVFVESNETQHLFPRNYSHYDNPQSLRIFQKLFVTQDVLIMPFSHESPALLDLDREHVQRQEIIKGWKRLGMQPDDIGYLSDADEIFTRDFFRAAQTCDIEYLDYEKHRCKEQMGLRGTTQVYESSPECLTKDRYWHHPDAMIGHCIEYIGREDKHPKAERESHWGTFRNETASIHVNASDGSAYYPLYNGADFRTVGGSSVGVHRDYYKSFEPHTAFHFHNFFTNSHAMRYKYMSYGHPVKDADQRKLDNITEDLAFVVGCIKKENDTGSPYKVDERPFDTLKPFQPIYFHDATYRANRHDFVRQMISEDEAMYSAKSNFKIW